MARTDLDSNERGNAMAVIVIIIVLAVIAGAAYWIWYKHKHSGTTTAAAPCAHLTLSQGSSSGAAGTIYKHAVLTNSSSTTCTITGYPGVFMRDASNMQVGGGAAANALYAVTTVTLSPGGQAHSVVAFPQQGNFDPGACSPLGSSMQMFVPGLATAVTASWSDYSCPGFSATAIQTGA
ncbi:MAG TPA: DUF4232 domain-containing protein [Candidatus Saccharimonadales bacterium]|nr:DUF4232 domain-containing protein [Candidatus Saccharimonadales bacterium]